MILRKFYDNDDFKEYFYDLHGSMPDIDYDEVTTIDTNGYIKESHLSYNFELKKDLTKQPDDILGNYELLGEVTADIDANLLL